MLGGVPRPEMTGQTHSCPALAHPAAELRGASSRPSLTEPGLVGDVAFTR